MSNNGPGIKQLVVTDDMWPSMRKLLLAVFDAVPVLLPLADDGIPTYVMHPAPPAHDPASR